MLWKWMRQGRTGRNTCYSATANTNPYLVFRQIHSSFESEFSQVCFSFQFPASSPFLKIIQYLLISFWYVIRKGKGHSHNRPQGPKGVLGRLRPRIFLTFGTTRVVGRQPHAPAAFTPRWIPWYSFSEVESTPGHMVPLVAKGKIPSVTPPGIDPETVRLVAQCLNHYATPGPLICNWYDIFVNCNWDDTRWQ
jgi:hypothetical protein